MKSFARKKREWFDSIVSNPGRLWSARAVIALLLAGAGTEAWIASTTMVERIGRSRTGALERGWALEWQLVDPQAPQPYGDVRKQFVQLHATLPRADFDEAQSFLRASAQADAKKASLVKLEGIGDREGISDLHWTLLVWVRTPRG